MVHNCLRARHIACFTIVHLICAKVQIVDNLSRISILKMILTFMRCHLSSGIFFIPKSMCMISTKYSTFVCTYLGGVILQLGCFETNTFTNGINFSNLSHVQQSHCKEIGVPGVKHHSSISIIMLISFHIYMLSPCIIQIKLSCATNC